MATEEEVVRVRWLKSTPQEGVLVGGRTYHGRGPVRQRRAAPVAGGHVHQTKPVEVEVAPGEETVLPVSVAEALERFAAGYVEILGA